MKRENASWRKKDAGQLPTSQIRTREVRNYEDATAIDPIWCPDHMRGGIRTVVSRGRCPCGRDNQTDDEAAIKAGVTEVTPRPRSKP